MKKITIIVLFIVLGTPLLFAQSKKELKKENAIQEYESIKSLIASRNYSFCADWITTHNGIKVDIIPSSNILTVAQDSTNASMQFFGEVNTIQFNTSQGVVFTNQINNYRVIYNDKKQIITVSYTVKNKSETYNIYMTITRSGYSYMDLYSNIKRNVTYDGKVMAKK